MNKSYFIRIFQFVFFSILAIASPLIAADISGTWIHGSNGENWTFTPNNEGTYQAVEQGFGNARGMAIVMGNRFLIIYATQNKAVTGFYDLSIATDGQSAEGQYRDSQPANGPARLVRTTATVSGGTDGANRNYIDKKWEIYVYPDKTFSGFWLFHADRRVEGITGAGQLAWTGTWSHLGQNRYVYEFDYQGSHNIEYVEFISQGQVAELRGYSDPAFRNQHRVGYIASTSQQHSNTTAVNPDIAVTVYWHMADDADVYLNGEPLRHYDPSFKTRADEAPRPAFSASAVLKNGDIFTIGGRRGGSYGFMLIAVDSAGRIVFQTDQQSWKAYEPGDRADWFNPQVALASQSSPVSVQPNPWNPQKQLNAEYGNKALSIWNTPENKFAYLYGIVRGIGTAATIPASGIAQQQLIQSIKTFRIEAIADPNSTLKKYSSINALRDFTGIENALFTQTPPSVGWKYYFATATYTVAPSTNQDYSVLFYHPWSDTAIMTNWQYRNKQYVMTHAELVLGDCIRQYGQTPFELQPLWELKSASITPLLAIQLAVGETIASFENIFPASGKIEKGSPFAQQRRNFDKNTKSGEIRKNMLLAANLRFERNITALIRYEQDKQFEVYRDSTSLLLAGIKTGDLSRLKVTVPQTSQETLDLIKANNKELGLFKVVSLLKTPKDCFVFLSHPADSNNILVFWFQSDKGNYGLRQANFINNVFSVSYVSELRQLISKVSE